jgi:hypothetical protein
VHPVKDGPYEEFYYRISAEGFAGVSAALQDVGDAGQSEIGLNIGEEASISVSSGYYRLTVRASLGDQWLIRREMIHIYLNTRTYKPYELTEDDVTPRRPITKVLKMRLRARKAGVPRQTRFP